MAPNSDTAVTQKSNNHAKALYTVFVFSVIIIWLPFKGLAYLLPFLSIIIFTLIANSGRTLQRLLFATILFLITVGSYYLFYLWLGERFLLQNAFLFLLTYGSFLFLIAIPRNAALHDFPLVRYMNVIKITILLQSLLGIFQIGIYVLISGGGFDSAAGDIVQGTLDPLSFITPEGNLNNQIFTINLLVLLLFYTPYAFANKRGLWVCMLGFTAVLFASVWHIFFSFIAALVVTAIYFTHSFIRLSARRLMIVVFVLTVIMVGFLLQPRNFGLISFYYEKVTSLESLKALVTKESVTELPTEYPWVYVTGLGPGQYCSRAGLISTGRYFGEFTHPKKLPLLKPESSNAFQQYVYPKWEEFATNPAIYGNSTMSRPFYSLLSLLIEFGYLLFAILVAWIFVLISRIRSRHQIAAKRKFQLASLYSVACGTLIAFYIFVSFFENYLEVAHAIFLGLLLFKYTSSSIKALCAAQAY
jgi:hypothetical protein